MSLLQRLNRLLATLENTLIVLLLLGLLGLGSLQVILRNVLSSGLFWADELLRHLVLWLGFLGASLATREQRHLNVDALARALPARCQPYLTLLTNLAALLVTLALFQAAWVFVHNEYTAGTMLSIGIPTWIAQSIVPVGFLLMALRFASHALSALIPLMQRKSRP